MRSYDLSPLFRSTIGFDHMSRLLDSVFAGEVEAPGYPPYNIEKLGENEYRITMAVAGFTPDDIEITQQRTSLVIRGKTREKDVENVRTLHRGIAARAFERRFELADHVEVKGARLENGLLLVDLVREVPEAMRPRTIAIEAAGRSSSLAKQAA